MSYDLRGLFDNQTMMIDGPHATKWINQLAIAIEVSQPKEVHEIQSQAVRTGAGGSVIVLPVHGVIEHRASIWSMFGLGTSTELLGRAFDASIADDSVSAVVFDIDTPGGDAIGTPEFADKVFKARGTKPIIAAVNAEANSAGFFIGSAADEVHITPSGFAGSIGVWTLHIDVSEMMEKDGVKATLISAGKFKVEGNRFEPLSKEAADEQQKQVNVIDDVFNKAVAKHRGVTVSVVRSDFGQGREMNARDAKAAGLVDKIQPFEATLARFAKSRPRRRSAAEMRALLEHAGQ